MLSRLCFVPFICYTLQEDAEKDSLASEMATRVLLSSSEAEDEIRTVQTDLQL